MMYKIKEAICSLYEIEEIANIFIYFPIASEKALPTANRPNFEIEQDISLSIPLPIQLKDTNSLDRENIS